MVNLQTFLGDFVKSVNYEFYPLSLYATIYKHFTNVLKCAELKTKIFVGKTNLQTFCNYQFCTDSESKELELELYFLFKHGKSIR